ncbi:hypothetical protein [Arthrobacter sp. H5]|uniref:hypothetical protein n=1 Tax=Arthrobacter sp. H5 TaxID=1267973 RepID=UPI000488087E|nr:hypothetical protein [Arthrobacter sp. H5]
MGGQGTTAARCETWAQDSQAVAALAYQVRLHSDSVDEICARLVAVAGIDWESPAGRNFRSYLGERRRSMAEVAGLLRLAAVQLDAHSAALYQAEAAAQVGQ